MKAEEWGERSHVLVEYLGQSLLERWRLVLLTSSADKEKDHMLSTADTVLHVTFIHSCQVSNL